MSTRATYHFKATELQPAVTIYIHYDGYPEACGGDEDGRYAGAAGYFWRMLSHKNERGGHSCQLVRAIELAELTTGRHGDTEFEYHINGEDLRAIKRIDFTDEWKEFYSGPIIDFVRQYGPDLPQLYPNRQNKGHGWADMDTVTDMLITQLVNLRLNVAKVTEAGGSNWPYWPQRNMRLHIDFCRSVSGEEGFGQGILRELDEIEEEMEKTKSQASA